MSLHQILPSRCESFPLHRTRAALRARRSTDRLASQQLIWPLFVQEGVDQVTPIASMPGCARVSIDRAIELASEAACAGLAGIALFPVVPDHLKDPRGQESHNRDGLMARAIRAIKVVAPDLLILSDVALDPYSSDGHDGVVIHGKIDNDATLPLLAEMALVQAQAGADLVAPANHREALQEVRLDEEEGADWLMVKPGLPYLDIVSLVRGHSALPVAVYHVSGEYAMLKAAAAVGLFSYEEGLLESLSSMHRAGADLIVTYGALDAARLLASRPPVVESPK